MGARSSVKPTETSTDSLATNVANGSLHGGATKIIVCPFAFTRYCYYQYCMVYGIRTGGRKEGRILPNSHGMVLHQGGQCRWARGMKGVNPIVHKILEVKEYLVPRPPSNVLSPASRRRAPARLRQPEPRMRLAVRGVPKRSLRTHSA